MSETTKSAARAAELITNEHLEGIAYEVGAANVPIAQRVMAETIDRETGLPELIKALEYPRFGNTANLLDKAIEQIESLSRRLNGLAGESWTPLYLHHYRNAAQGIRAALAKARGDA